MLPPAMTNHPTEVELLAPAGNWDCARAAAAAGADAIFFGLPRFNARLRADNFTHEDLPELMKFLHRHGMRGLVTMNTLIFPSEIKDAAEQLLWLESCHVDAVIIQDLGLAKIAAEIAPRLAIHASTQMTITSPEGLNFINQSIPLQRAVLARELSVKELHRFQKAASAVPAPTTPLEVFVHGALCVAYSGQCLTSESLGQRSANRGECAQACRMPYELIVDGKKQDLREVRYLLSPQDLAAVDLIPDLITAGIKSFKIEGRLKSPEYVTAVTRVYRKAIDAAIAGNPSPVNVDDRYSLEMTFSRGLSTGWLAGTNHPYLTHGRYGKKRGALLGEISHCAPGWIQLTSPPTIPLHPGDGIVFDAGEDRNHEQGGRIWKLENNRIYFHKTFTPLDWTRIHPGQQIWKTSDQKLDSELRRHWQNAKLSPQKTPLEIHATGTPGQPLTLHAHGPSSSASATSTIPLSTAQNHPITAATLTEQLSRLGDTDFTLAQLHFDLQGPCHLPLSEINRTRRALISVLTTDVPAPPTPRPAPDISFLYPTPPLPSEKSPTLSCLCRTMPQLEAAVSSGIDTIYCDFEDPRRYKDAVALHPRVILATPRIIKPGEDGYLTLIERAQPRGFLLRNLAALRHFQNHKDITKIADFSLNVANPITARLLRETAHLDRLTISYDLNITQVLDLIHQTPPDWLELTIHQHMPMFHMEHCVFCTFLSTGTTYKDCGRPCEKHIVHLRDRVGQLHRLSADVGCRNTLFNGRAQTGARFLPELLHAGLRHYRIELLDESGEASTQRIALYQDLIHGRSTFESMSPQLDAIEKLGVTEGTLRTGV